MLFSDFATEFISEKDLDSFVTNEQNSIGHIDTSRGIIPALYFFIRAIGVIRDKIVRNV